MREVLERLERLDVQYYMTGSEALARYGEPRQTMDVDIVVGVGAREFEVVARAFEDDYLVNEPLDFGTFSLASLIAKSALGKADLILGRHDAWSSSAMDRRMRWDHPLYGSLWVISLEDLVLAKLEWSKGSSELQLRDCRNLLALNRDLIDWPYVERGRRFSGCQARLPRCAMRAEPSRAAMDARVAASSVADRVAWLATMREAAMRTVWQQIDAAEIIDPVEQAGFLLRRLYPEESESWFVGVVDRLRAARAAGTWDGFQRPGS